jgi:hypothetical protein
MNACAKEIAKGFDLVKTYDVTTIPPFDLEFQMHIMVCYFF